MFFFSFKSVFFIVIFFFCFSCQKNEEEETENYFYSKKEKLRKSVGSFRSLKKTNLLDLSDYEKAKNFSENDLEKLSSDKIKEQVTSRKINFPLSEKQAQDFFLEFYDLGNRSFNSESLSLPSDKACVSLFRFYEVHLLSSILEIVGDLKKISNEKKMISARKKISKKFQETIFLAFENNKKNFGEKELFWFLKSISHKTVCEKDENFEKRQQQRAKDILKETAPKKKFLDKNQFSLIASRLEGLRYLVMNKLKTSSFKK